MTLRYGTRLTLHALPGLCCLVVYALVVVPLSRLRGPSARRSPAMLWGPVPIINIRYSSLVDRRIGLQSLTLVYRTYRREDAHLFDRVLDKYTRVRVLGQLVPYAVFLWAGLRFDGFGFFFDGGLLGETPFWRMELPLLRAARKKTIVYPYGGDARIPSIVRAREGWHAYSDVPVGKEDRSEAHIIRRVTHISRWAEVVLGFADLVDDLPRHDDVLLHPFDSESHAVVEQEDSSVVRIVHAANHRHYKGTQYLIDSVAVLQREGLPVELVLVERVPLEEARMIYRTAHVVAEQFLIGAYGLFAVEAMALGKPVVCYLNPRFAEYHHEWKECPIVSANPDTLTDALRSLLDSRWRTELGRRGRAYALKYHSSAALATAMTPIYASLWPKWAKESGLGAVRDRR